jgi:ribonuclease P protein component
VLSIDNRLRRPTEFRAVIAGGAKVRRGSLVVHQLTSPPLPGPDGPAPRLPIVGFVVGRAVGPSVVRHRVTRRLRAQVRERLTALPAGSATVVRALPGAAAADSRTLGRDLDAALTRLGARPPARGGTR